MNEPTAERAMAAIATLLSDLSGLRPGGWTYPRTPSVTRELAPPGYQMRSEDLPRITIIPGTKSRLVQQAGRLGIYQHEFHIDIYGFVEGDSEVIADTWRWRLRQDILETLHQHLSLDGLLVRPLDFSERPQEVDSGDLVPKGYFMQPITVRLLDTYQTAA